MITHQFELRLRGDVPETVAVELGAAPHVLRQSESVLVTGRISQRRLHELLVRMYDLGLDINEYRRLPEYPPAARTSTEAPHHDGIRRR